jgi:hypothetical protein
MRLKKQFSKFKRSNARHNFLFDACVPNQNKSGKHLARHEQLMKLIRQTC